MMTMEPMAHMGGEGGAHVEPLRDAGATRQCAQPLGDGFYIADGRLPASSGCGACGGMRATQMARRPSSSCGAGPIRAASQRSRARARGWLSGLVYARQAMLRQARSVNPS